MRAPRPLLFTPERSASHRRGAARAPPRRDFTRRPQLRRTARLRATGARRTRPTPMPTGVLTRARRLEPALAARRHGARPAALRKEQEARLRRSPPSDRRPLRAHLVARGVDSRSDNLFSAAAADAEQAAEDVTALRALLPEAIGGAAGAGRAPRLDGDQHAAPLALRRGARPAARAHGALQLEPLVGAALAEGLAPVCCTCAWYAANTRSLVWGDAARDAERFASLVVLIARAPPRREPLPKRGEPRVDAGGARRRRRGRVGRARRDRRRPGPHRADGGAGRSPRRRRSWRAAAARACSGRSSPRGRASSRARAASRAPPSSTRRTPPRRSSTRSAAWWRSSRRTSRATPTG